MSKRRYDFNEEDNQFAKIIYNIRYNKECINNFIEYVKSQINTAIDSKDIKKYEKILKRIQKRGHIGNNDIADIIDRNVSTVDRWMSYFTNTPKNPDITVLPKLSKAFGVTVDYLLGLIKPNETNNVEYSDLISISDYPTLTALGFDINMFQRKYNMECNEIDDLTYVIQALELLLNHKSSPYSILSNIGKYLTAERNKYGLYIDGMSIDSLKEYIKEMIETPSENIDISIDAYFLEKKPVQMKWLEDMTINNISNGLKNYRTELETINSNG